MIILSGQALQRLLEYMATVQEEVREALQRAPVTTAHAAPTPGYTLTAEQVTEVLTKLADINEFFIATILDSVVV